MCAYVLHFRLFFCLHEKHKRWRVLISRSDSSHWRKMFTRKLLEKKPGRRNVFTCSCFSVESYLFHQPSGPTKVQCAWHRPHTVLLELPLCPLRWCVQGRGQISLCAVVTIIHLISLLIWRAAELFTSFFVNWYFLTYSHSGCSICAASSCNRSVPVCTMDFYTHQ